MENGGKADAINAGLNLTQYPFVCCIDADTLIERNSLAILMTRLLSNNEEIACAGSIRPLNGLVLDKERNVYSLFLPGSFIQKIQTIEYIRSFTLARSGLNLLNGNLIISGAFGVFDRKTLIEIGGYQQLSKGEDIEIVVKIQKRMREQKRAFRIAYHPDAVAWTYLPDNLADLQKQRIRWHLGLLSTIITLNKNVFLNPRYGTMGLVVFPYYIFVEIISPFLEPAGFIYTLILIALGLLKWHFLLLFWGAPVIACWITSLIALLIDHYFLHYYSIRQYGLLSIYGLMEGLWYHYLTVWWRLQATYIWLFGKPSRRTGWQSPRRNK
jgi:cellulose synthase/poly-beta-1,6-N-acetylglucosamine synthase-like glycosyltransferase